MTTGPRNVAASVRARLLNKARADKQDFNLLLTRYALERMLYRLSISAYRDCLRREWRESGSSRRRVGHRAGWGCPVLGRDQKNQACAA